MSASDEDNTQRTTIRLSWVAPGPGDPQELGQYLVVIDSDYWRPRSRARSVTGFAHVSTTDMGVALADSNASIVTTGAGTGDFVVIHIGWSNRLPGCRSR